MGSDNGIYENYVTNRLSKAHDADYLIMSRYFNKNYTRFLSSYEERILDVGCGMGHFLFFLKKFGFSNVTAIDKSKECVDYCVGNNLIAQHNIYHVGLEEFLQNKLDKFDIIVLNDVLEHISKESIITCLRSIKEALGSKGRIIIKVVNAANPITGSASRYNDFTHTIGFTEESLEQVLRMAGYREVKIYPQKIWVYNWFVNLLGASTQGLINIFFRTMNLLYGRRTTKIFTKDLIAIGFK